MGGPFATLDGPEPVMVAVTGESPLSVQGARVDLDLSKFPDGRWALQLDAAFARRGAPAVILAHGVVCLAVAWWAQLSPRSYLQSIHGALFRSPLKAGFGQASIAATASTGPMQRLPFPSIVASEVTPYIGQVLALADRWGSRFVDIDDALSAGPSNRNAAGIDSDAMLRTYLDLLTGRAAPDGGRLADASNLFDSVHGS